MASLRAQFEEHLSCAICLEQFVDPKVLPCLHSYCHKCIVKLERTRGNIRCPECRMTVKVGDPPDISFLPSNFFANNLIATLSLASSSDGGKIVCENCDSGDCGETRCEQCNRYLCQFCTDAHKRARDTKNHTMKSLNELKESQTPIIAEAIRCRKHQDEFIKLYCSTCQSTICRDCAVMDHRDHDFSFITEVAQRNKDELQKLVVEVKKGKKAVSAAMENLGQLERKLNARCESTMEKVNKHFGKLAGALDSEKNRIVNEVNILKNSKLKKLHAQREQLEVTLASCESSVSFTEQAFENGDDVQILNMKKYISKSLESLKNKSSLTRPGVDDIIGFVTTLRESDIVDKTVLQCSVVDGNTETEYKCYFEENMKWLSIGIECVVIVSAHSGQLEPASVNIKASITGVKVENVTMSKNRNGTHAISFVPVEVGVLQCEIFVNGRRLQDSILKKMVKWVLAVERSCDRYTLFIGSGVFRSGFHTWEIELNHDSDCCHWCHDRAVFTIGVIGRDNHDNNPSPVGLTGYVKSECSINFDLDMSKKELVIFPSWRERGSVYTITSSRVTPYFRVNCDECFAKITAIGLLTF